MSPVSPRLVNYCARVALANPNENELLLILNIPVTGALRSAIEEGAKDRRDYPFAWQALQKYRTLETQMHRGQKNLQRA
jgi:hypothetical protein